MRTGKEVRALRIHVVRANGVRPGHRALGDTIELAVELPFETGAPMEAIRAAAAGEVHE